MPKAYPREFRDDVIAVYRQSDATQAQIARDFGISESCLQRWLAQADIDAGQRAGVSTVDSVELRDVKKRNRVLEMENEILRRAAAFFAKDISPK